MAWIAKNDPNWDKYLTQAEDHEAPDVQWEMALRGDKYALMLEMEYLAGLAEKIDHNTNVLMRRLHELREGLERHSAAGADDAPMAEDSGA